MTGRCAFRYFATTPETICLAAKMCIRVPATFRKLENLSHDRGIEISDETARYGWNRFGPMFTAKVRSRNVDRMRAWHHWHWFLTSCAPLFPGNPGQHWTVQE